MLRSWQHLFKCCWIVVKSVLLDLAEQLGVKLLTIVKKSVSTAKKLATLPKKTVTTNVEGTLMSARIVAPLISFSFKKRPIDRVHLLLAPWVTNGSIWYVTVSDLNDIVPSFFTSGVPLPLDTCEVKGFCWILGHLATWFVWPASIASHAVLLWGSKQYMLYISSIFESCLFIGPWMRFWCTLGLRCHNLLQRFFRIFKGSSTSVGLALFLCLQGCSSTL